MNLSLLFILSAFLLTSSSAQLISPSSPPSQTSTPSVSLPTSTSTSSTNIATQTSTSTTSTTSSTSTIQTPSSTSTSTTHEPTSTSLSTAPVQNTVLSTSTSDGALGTVTVTSTGASSSSSPPSATGPPPQSNDSAPTLGTGPIIGISVAGGIAVIGIIAFVVWKMTKKRFSDYSDNEAIKWPELNSHGNPDSLPFPAHGASRAGLEAASEVSLSRAGSAKYSTADFSAGSGPDLYAVPPLPHLNPNQPYRDDPAGASPGYYDPYRGPVPGTLETDSMDWPGEAIPMTRVNATARTMSPGPSANFVNDGGRQSPAPHLVSHGRASPGPQVGYEGTGYGGR